LSPLGLKLRCLNFDQCLATSIFELVVQLRGLPFVKNAPFDHHVKLKSGLHMNAPKKFCQFAFVGKILDSMMIRLPPKSITIIKIVSIGAKPLPLQG
jgi:hypothetical protein